MQSKIKICKIFFYLENVKKVWLQTWSTLMNKYLDFRTVLDQRLAFTTLTENWIMHTPAHVMSCVQKTSLKPPPPPLFSLWFFLRTCKWTWTFAFLQWHIWINNRQPENTKISLTTTPNTDVYYYGICIWQLVTQLNASTSSDSLLTAIN